jgi:hypothetical protein
VALAGVVSATANRRPVAVPGPRIVLREDVEEREERTAMNTMTRGGRLVARYGRASKTPTTLRRGMNRAFGCRHSVGKILSQVDDMRLAHHPSFLRFTQTYSNETAAESGTKM